MMPEQFINVKNSDIQQTNLFSDVVKKQQQQDNFRFGSSSNISNSNSDICRICHCESDNGNPLLSPCYCSGSLKYVHQSCLQQWLAASDTRSCELCKFNFILHTKIKPIGEWRRLEMSTVERRRLLCAILFHFVAAVCVIWSLFVLIDRAAEEVQKGLIAWPFWTKLVVVAVGFTGGAVFMYIQCRQYLHLFSRWKAHNRIILVQNAPEKAVITPPSPNFNITVNPPPHRAELPSQVVANVEHPPPTQHADGHNFVQSTCSIKDEPGKEFGMYIENDLTSVSSLQKSDSLRSDSNNLSSTQNYENHSLGENLSLGENRSLENRSQSIGNQSMDNRSLENRSIGNQSYENRSIGNRSYGNRSMENQSIGSRSYENRSMENQSFEDRSHQSYENRSVGDRSLGDRSLGDRSVGDRSLGDRSLGDRGLGDRGLGDRSLGDRSLGDRNLGDRSLGDRNLGDRNLGDRNLGDRNLGDRNLGDRSKGDPNVGGRSVSDQNAGGPNIGGRSTGVRNTGARTTGKHSTRNRSIDNPSTERVSIGDNNSCDALELNIQEILALDIEYNNRSSRGSHLGQSSSKSTQEKMKSKSVFKSLPNLSASSENLLV